MSAATPQGRAIASQSAGSQGGETLYALPVEETIRYDIEDQQIEFRTTVVRIGGEAAPADLIAIPPGARLVKSRIVEVNEEIETLFHPTPLSKGH